MVARLARLVSSLKKFSFSLVAQALAGLLTRPENQTATARIEVLIHLAALTCRGVKRPGRQQLNNWLNVHLLKEPITQFEGPVEDVFVSNVEARFGNARLFAGRWHNNGEYVQACIEALLKIADRAWAQEALTHVMALLRVSEAVAERAGITRNSRTASQPWDPIAFSVLNLRDSRGRVSFSNDQLSAIGVDPNDLEPFVLQREHADMLIGQSIGHTALERRPLVRTGSGITVALPTAIGAAVRRFVIERAKAKGELQPLQSTFHLVQFSEIFLLGRADWSVGYVNGVDAILDNDMREFVGTFDDGGYVHLLYVPDDFEEIAEDGLAKPHKLKDAVRDRMQQRAAQLAGEQDYQRGLTVLVHGGIGREFSPVLGEFPSGWHQLCISAPDFMFLGLESDWTAIRAWKLLQQVDDLKGKGVFFPTLRGFLNLAAFAYYGGFELVPQNMGLDPIYLHNDLILPLRHRVRTALDRHAAIAPDGESWVGVQRETTAGHFGAPQGRPVFFSYGHRAHRQLLGCIETAARPWWVYCAELPESGWHHGLTLNILELVLNWLVRLAPAIEERLVMLPPGPVTYRLRFPHIETIRQNEIAEHETSEAPAVAVEDGVITIDCTPRYLHSFLSPGNLGDRLMLTVLVRGAHLLCGQPVPSDTVVNEVVGAVIESESARFLKLTPARTPQDMIYDAAGLPELRVLAPEDWAWSRLNLARRAGRLSAPGPLPPERSRAILNTAVDCVWKRVRSRLDGLSRESVIERSLLNFVASQKKHRDGLRSMAAQDALYDREQVQDVSGEHAARRDAASLASRIIAEMALCASPYGAGATCTWVDLDFLIAEVSTLLECAGQSDALRYGLLAEQPIMHANGSFGFVASTPRWPGLLRKERWTRTFRDVAIDDAASLESSADGQVADPGFEVAFVAEFGLSTEQYAKFVLHLTLEALQQNIAHLWLQRSGVLKRLRRAGVVNAEGVYEALALAPRARWDEKKPNNAKPRDWYPWRYNRRLSVLRRPLVQLSLEDDPAVLVMPSIVAHTLDYLQQAAFGRLPEELFDSQEMVSCIGRAADRIGSEFTRKVATRFSQLGWKTRREVKLTQLGGGSVHGDIDVLAWRPATGVVYLVECKNLRFDRTWSEIGERLTEYATGTVEGKRTRLQRHLDRISFLKSNPDRLLRLTNIPVERLQIRSALVTEQLAPMQFSGRAREMLDVVTDYELLEEAIGS